jgi:hypothetical protein
MNQKFKVGDLVRPHSPYEYEPPNKNWLGVVTCVKYNKVFSCDFFEIHWLTGSPGICTLATEEYLVKAGQDQNGI